MPQKRPGPFWGFLGRLNVREPFRLAFNAAALLLMMRFWGPRLAQQYPMSPPSRAAGDGDGAVAARPRLRPANPPLRAPQNCPSFGRHLNGLFKQAVTAGKHVRAETSVPQPAARGGAGGGVPGRGV